MKKIIFTIAILISGFSSNLMAQSFPDPEFSSRPYILEANKTLKNLERADAQIETKMVGMGYGGVETYFTAFEPESDVRLSMNSLPKLIIKVEGNVDPSEIISLSEAEVKRDRRRFLQSSRGIRGRARDVSDTYIKLEFKKIRDGIFEVVLPSDIQPGEYAFMPINSGGSNSSQTYNSKVKISCFGID
jgi:hypothetical protein